MREDGWWRLSERFKTPKGTVADTTGLLLVNLGFGFSDFQIFDSRDSFFCNIFLKNMLVRYRGINNKGVLERPGQNGGFRRPFLYFEMSVYRQMLKSGLSDSM